MVRAGDLKVLKGKWEGMLTYLDYSSAKRVSIPVTLQVKNPADNQQTWYFHFSYPNEPGANSTDTAVIDRNGEWFNGQQVTDREKTGKGALLLVTRSAAGADEGKTFRYTYTISRDNFIIRKEEKGLNDSAYFERNKYVFSRRNKL